MSGVVPQRPRNLHVAMFSCAAGTNLSFVYKKIG
jgi:hypothetical protein